VQYEVVHCENELGDGLSQQEARSPFDLTGQVALVTGASRGIGLAACRALAAAGADIIGASRRMTESCGGLAAELGQLGREFEARNVDMGDRAGVAELADAMLRRERPVDVLVNNAGIIRRGPAAAHSAQDWDQVVATDLSGPFFLAQSLGRQMVQRRRGRIIFTASLLSFQGGINVISYAAAKSGLLGMTRAFANEWAPYGVNVNAVVPGYIATDVTAVLRTDPERNRSITERIPAGRWGAPEDVAGTIVFLASAASAYVCGAAIPVDGGWLSR
jgi:2-dehydro-3-deoxy-D-gluconate 5-dehydrogenase